MWKSGAGWANPWAGVFLPVHGFVHALEPRSARQGRFPHIHGSQLKSGRDAARKSRRREAGLLLAAAGGKKQGRPAAWAGMGRRQVLDKWPENVSYNTIIGYMT
jgi:hypothetical protein